MGMTSWFKQNLALHDHDAPILQVKDVSLRYEAYPALEDISFDLESGERIAVVGPNGAGKSTLFKIIAGVLTPSTGSIKIYGHRPTRHICIAYVPQRSEVDWDFPVSVFDAVMMGRVGQIGFFKPPLKSDQTIVMDGLEAVGMQDLAKRQVGELSGGQQQRMFIARALAQQAELVLMDEPLTGLDVNSQEDILDILQMLHKNNVTVMVATHNLDLAASHFDRVMLLNNRLFGFGKPQDVFSETQLSAAYGGRSPMQEGHHHG